MGITVYRSKVDGWLMAIIIYVMAISIWSFIAFDWNSVVTQCAVAVSVLLFILVLYLLFSIRYIIAGNVLTVKCGSLYKRMYDINKIKSIKPTCNPLSSPAASLDRLEIKFIDSRNVLLISPKNKQSFVDHICRINVNVSLLKK